MNDETTVWKGPSSQVINLGIYVVCGLLCVLIVPIFVAIWKWIENRCRIYEVTSQRVKITTGVFTRKTDELELYRVIDMSTVQSFWQRLFGVADIVLVTNDATSPRLVLEAVPGPDALRENLRIHVEECREKKKVRLTELE